MPNIVRAIGQALVLTPLVRYHHGRHAEGMSAAASGLFNMMRNLGGAVGTAMLATILTKREQFHSNIIGQSVTPYGNTVEQFLTKMQDYFLAARRARFATRASTRRRSCSASWSPSSR